MFVGRGGGGVGVDGGWWYSWEVGICDLSSTSASFSNGGVGAGDGLCAPGPDPK